MKKFLYVLSISLVAGGAYLGYKNTSVVTYQERSSSHLLSSDQSASLAQNGFEDAMAYYRMIAGNQETGLIENWMVQQATDNIITRVQRRMDKPITWEFAGPDNVGGRTRAYLIDRANSRLRFAGAVSGGVFRSSNAGVTWQAVNPLQENLNVSSLTQTKDGIIYYGTGEGGFVSVSGSKNGTPGFAAGGIFRSEDGGQTFNSIPGTNAWAFTSILAADSIKPERLWAGTQSGLRYSDDKGVSWTVIPGTGNCREVQIASDGTIFAYFGANNIIRSTDGGATFTPGQIQFRSPIARLRIAVSPQDPNYVYVVSAIQGSTSMEGLYRSTDKGATFQLIQAGGSTLFNPLSQIGTLQGQGNFDLCLTVDPENRERCIIGGVQLAEWNNGNAKMIGSLASFPQNPFYVHADKHEFLWDYSTQPPTLIICTDGGMFHSTDKGTTFVERTRNYTTTQFYGLAVNQAGHIFGGTQDNGTLLVNGNGNTPLSSVRVLGGDGFQTEFSRLSPNVLFAESQYGNLRRSINGGVSFAPIWDNRLTGSGAGVSFEFADFNAQFKLWENDANEEDSRLFFCTRDRVWMAINSTNTSQIPSWFVIADNASGIGGGRFIDIEYSEDGGSLFICRGSSLSRVDGINLANFDTLVLSAFAKDANLTVTNVGANLPNGSRTITSINLDPNNPNRALVTLGNYGNATYVFLSENILDASPTFTNISGNLPRFPVYDGIISTENPNYFVVVTEFGVWASENGGATWEEQNEGMARVPTYIIRQYKWNQWEGPRVYIATHGAGYFKSNSLLTSARATRKPTAKQVSLSAYPNPASKTTTINVSSEKNLKNAEVRIMDMQGRIVKTQNLGDLMIGTNTIILDLDGLKTANYLVMLQARGFAESTRISVFN